MAGIHFDLTEDTLPVVEEIGLPYILKQFETRNQFTVSFVRNLEGGPRHYLVDLVRVLMPGGRMGVMMGFKDVDEDVKACLAAGMNAHISKPFTPEGLRKTLDEQILK